MRPAIRTWREERSAWVELNRPEKLNALDRAALRVLRETLAAAGRDPETRVLLLTGAGDRAFCAGADIADMHAQGVAGIREMMEEGKEAARLLEQSPQPSIAVVNGFALGGGCELALACDLVLASEGARFALPEVDLGVIPGWGGTQRLERRVGFGRAREMLLTGRQVPAEEALAWGLCDRVLPPDRLRAEATAMAAVLAARDPGALAGVRRALLRRGETTLEEGLAFETDLFVELFVRPERAEAMERFLSRRR